MASTLKKIKRKKKKKKTEGTHLKDTFPNKQNWNIYHPLLSYPQNS